MPFIGSSSYDLLVPIFWTHRYEGDQESRSKREVLNRLLQIKMGKGKIKIE
jgi:hypothetical protein